MLLINNKKMGTSQASVTVPKTTPLNTLPDAARAALTDDLKKAMVGYYCIFMQYYTALKIIANSC